ncbi:MAG TPA: creatininase family protein [Usitatibacter sp.]|nr:creatininase family protein [Usitatibacter sp.]
MKRLLVFASLLLACLVARAGTSVFLEDLTSPEIRAAVQAGKTTILVPIGGTEQNGPHMAVGKHNVRARWFAQRIASSLGDALVAPVIAYVPEGGVDPPVAHMRFPGTITVPEDVFEKTLESAAASFRLHGFRDIVFLGDHGGYRRSLARVAARLDREWKGTAVRVHALPEYYEAQTSGFARLLRSKGYTDAQIGTHAGLADTALTLAIDPSLVRPDQLGAAAAKGAADGVHGDPRAATAELGRLGADLVIERSVAAIRKATAGRR